ncbi:two component transcriptional regulator, LuxR family [Paraburkholderia caribensis MBA4]|uniref:Two component transcriptional regulator, LuxR family n=1 Tax=Paraburkholderia caribensis MBA4 TaxID=1323664 RepID=A0A0P0RI49_9BURK|nr:response regulator [Paraburkholderia caribensis]ALL68280.1 two component transcriptional regulator, LuxR family [Paraburkholderia caribensis MBA4]
MLVEDANTLQKRDSVEPPVVYVVDDDRSTRESISALLRSVDLRVEIFGSTRDFLLFPKLDTPSCLLLDVRLPNESGLELQQQLVKSGLSLSIIFISGHGDIPMTVQAMKAGALDFLTKPFRDQDLLDAVRNGLRRHEERLTSERSIAQLRNRYESMSEKEKKIMGFVVAGLMNKQIADRMNLSEITIKTHRAHAMKKMESRTLAEFVRIGEMLGLEPTHSFLSRGS